MKTLYMTNSSENLAIDTENNTVCSIPNESRYDIRSIYLIDEPMHIVYSSSNRNEEYDVKKGDIVIRVYEKPYFDKTIIVVKSKDWVKYITNQRAAEQKQKEEWAKQKAEENTCKPASCCADCTESSN